MLPIAIKRGQESQEKSSRGVDPDLTL